MKTITYNPSMTGAAFHASPKKIRGIRGPVGCLDGETEVLTRSGWKKIRDWRGEEILLWAPDGGVARFGRPRKYIVAPCEKMLRFDCGRHMEMRLTANHRVPLYGWDGRFVVKSAEEVARHPSRHVVPTTWRMLSRGVGMSDDEIRLWVATCADGNYPRAGKQCVFAFRKARKVERLKALLGRMGIAYRLHVTHRSDGADESKLTISRTGLPKHFDWRVAGFSNRQLEVFVDELKYWDGLVDSGHDRYDTTNAGDAEIVQFASHAIGRNATISVTEDKRNSRWSKNYSVHIARNGSPKNKVALRGDSFKSEWVDTSDGKQYCFETDTGFFVARYNGHVFVTGNSGKSVTCCFDIFLRSMEQKPCRDGVVRNRWLVLRNTLPELKDTTVKTWLHWFPTTEMNWTPPYHGVLRVPHLRNPRVMVEIELIFMGCDQPDFEEKLKSLEITGCWGNEACQIRWATLNEAFKRCGRFPSKDDGAEAFESWGLIMDTNSPDDSNWWYVMECVKKYDEMAFFVQPPALIRYEKGEMVWYEPNRGQDLADPRPAENVENLNEGYEYYMKQIVGTDEDVIKRLLLNQFGTTMAGKPVYPEWRDRIHLASETIMPNFGLPFILGTDFGRTPASVIMQMSPAGYLMVLDEVVSEGMGITQFTQEMLRPRLVNQYNFLRGARVINFADPAGSKADQVDEVTCIQRMNQNGIYTIPCPIPSNSFVTRRECVSDLLRLRIDDKPGLVVSPKCQILRKGFNGGYCYRKMRGINGGDDRYTEEADKNEFSHIHDGLQYGAYGALHSGQDVRSPISVTGNSRYFGLYGGAGGDGAGLDIGGFGV